MGTTADKLNKILESKAAIKAAIEAKGVSDVGDVLAEYPDKIASISGGGKFVVPNGLKFGYSNVFDATQFDISQVTNMSNMFYDYKGTSLDLSSWDTSNVTSMLHMFSNCRNLTTIPQLDISKVTDVGGMFSNCSSLTTISQLDTSNVTSMWNMFGGCSKLTTIPLLNVSSVSDMGSMFYNCNSLAYLKLTNLGTESSLYPLDLSYSSSLGDDTKVAGARQALIDTLITYSFDRASAGYSTCKILLSTATKALLTEDEIAQITAKGFTIS